MNIQTRKKARQYIIQALYSWQISKNDIIDIEHQYMKNINQQQVDITYFHELITKITLKYQYLDKIISLYINRKLEKIDQIEKAILRLSFYEMIYKLNIPNKVLINESIELAKRFGSKYSYKFINGVLDKAVNNIRLKKK
ncbi:transcription antitermination factor NusB [Buchnera aphidicola]|uniref:Transcription antitermination protein NusB n=1 Tax=Buchnera aphidicola (Stegophylla sp.) TaxID=2315800 RepID=A0A4D6YBG3_9GAMM|nr:transcription antitermination factor NusB [Buchnera aphidicola (Stegophylla sp.)]QCI26442.1 transcription antitermination factor NusB [Buchnera aphidicola (Stegophylla sp.)]